jgi:uncharacterized repeat protein (TIGR03803 family)
MKLKGAAGPLSVSVLFLTASIGRAASLTPLGTFSTTNLVGIHPQAGIYVDSAGDVIGTTSQAGSFNQGTIFQVQAGTATPVTIASFAPSTTFPNTVYGNTALGQLVADAAGNVYGAAMNGENGSGEVFEISAATHQASTPLQFTTAMGSIQSPVAVDAAGDLFVAGTGPANSGAIYEQAAGASTVTTVAAFAGSNGAFPNGLLVDARGDIFGTIGGNGGNSNANGSVFEIAAGSHTPTTLATFAFGQTSFPINGLVMDSAGDLFGETARNAGSTVNLGALYEITAGSHSITTLYTFDETHGQGPVGGLIIDAAGDLFGTTSGGGANFAGTVFEYAPSTQTVSDVYSFAGNDGLQPEGGVVADANGNLYGTTYDGGNFGDGTVFELTNTGFVTAVPEPVAGAVVLVGAGLLARRRPHRGA